MKNILTLIVLVAAALHFSSCGDEEVSERELHIRKLTDASWGNPTVTHLDGDLSDEYSNFIIAFDDHSADNFDGSFLIANGGNAFRESSGKWRLNAGLDRIIFDSGLELDYRIEDTTLSLDFAVPEPSDGRIDGLSGHFTFFLERL